MPDACSIATGCAKPGCSRPPEGAAVSVGACLLRELRGKQSAHAAPVRALPIQAAAAMAMHELRIAVADAAGQALAGFLRIDAMQRQGAMQGAAERPDAWRHGEPPAPLPQLLSP